MNFFPLVFSLLSICSHGQIKGNTAPKDPGPVNKQLVLQLINQARKEGRKCGEKYYDPAPPLSWNELLEKAASGHSNDMFKKNYFNHIEADGSNGGVRLDNVGYSWRAYGENIGWGYTTEQQVVDGWLKSPGHCKNIMDQNFKEMAVARAGNYWTQDFGTKE